MGINFSEARTSLQISQAQFDALDELDGPKDGRINESIFQEAKRQRSAIEENPKEPISSNPYSEQIKNILNKGRTIWNSITQGTALNPSSNRHTGVEEVAVQSTEEIENYLHDLGKEVASYYLEHRSINGFSSGMGMPNNLAIQNIEVFQDYTSGKNDDFRFEDMPTTERNPDGLHVVINYDAPIGSGFYNNIYAFQP